MTSSPARTALRRLARPAIVGLAILTCVQGASAEEGLGGFLASIFGGAPQTAAAPPEVREAVPVRRFRSRPLVVRLHRAKPRAVMTAAAQPPGKTGPVSIFEDRTLRRGDAVMTPKGVRVFAGSTSWPYAPTDFVSLSDAPLSRDTTKVLATLDRVPRG